MFARQVGDKLALDISSRLLDLGMLAAVDAMQCDTCAISWSLPSRLSC
jgi:hypothetical protein